MHVLSIESGSDEHHHLRFPADVTFQMLVTAVPVAIILMPESN